MGGNFQKLMQQAQGMQDKLKEIQDGLGDKTVEATSGGGMVKVIVNGKQELVSIEIDPEIIKADERDMLQDLVVAAVNEGMRNSQQMAQEALASVTAGLNIPGMGNLF